MLIKIRAELESEHVPTAFRRIALWGAGGDPFLQAVPLRLKFQSPAAANGDFRIVVVSRA